MKKSQWITFGIIFFVGSIYFSILGLGWNSTCMMLSSTMTGETYDATTALTYAACVIKTQSYIIPSFILFFLAVGFWICAMLEKGK